jgi:peptidoglycan/LPS O-acetylase OafA/YrhL
MKEASAMATRWLFTILYGLLTIWTGLWRGIEAQAYKPNALWFCLVTGIAAIAAGFLYRMNKRPAAMITALVVVVLVLGFYFHCFIAQPEKGATFRVGLIVVASIGELVVILLPGPAASESTAPPSPGKAG